ncbi:MAG: DUF2490 domain-containing protein [Gammaproteobacteria bacterium]|nr:DUF2490 domain-containing protein [Gammaproteobacteria bacterium]
MIRKSSLSGPSARLRDQRPERTVAPVVRIAIVALCLAPWTTALSAENTAGAWTTLTTTGNFQTEQGASAWHYWVDSQARYFDLGSGINQYLIRPAVGYEFGSGLTAWVGYARFRTRNRSGNVADENRYWQQLSWTAGRWYGGRVSMRARLEQRSVSIGSDLGLVLRLATKYVRPVGPRSNTNLVMSLEPFVDLKSTDWGGDAGLGQNRFFVGLGWQLSDSFALEAGYMNQYIWADSSADRSNHFGVLNFRLTP